jgi:predicted aspartyl protease
MGTTAGMLATLMFRSERLRPRRTRRTGARVAVTFVAAMVQRPDGTGRRRRVRFLVDSGAVYTVLPAPVGRGLGLVPSRRAEFSLADGTTITRGIAEARFRLGGYAATSPVVCGEDHDGALFGAVTLETLGLMLNPLSRELLPMRLVLG